MREVIYVHIPDGYFSPVFSLGLVVPGIAFSKGAPSDVQAAFGSIPQ
jgi:hypothetical protein